MTAPTKTIVILCSCSGIISDRINWEKVQALLKNHPARPEFVVDELACGADNLEHLTELLRGEKPDNLVVAACSPRDHEATFRKLLADAGVNPWQLQMVNLREQVAWVTADPQQATNKAARMIFAALNRVQHHKPLFERRQAIRTEVAVIGAGPAGMQAALTLARAGRKVALIEKEPFIGGLPVRFEELFPNLECGPCLLEPLMGDLLHGFESDLVQLHTLAEVIAVTGSFGNWNLTVRKNPRYINPDLCIGCMICAEVCPSKRNNRWNVDGEISAVDSPFAGALPNLPHIDSSVCLKLQGKDCNICQENCPVPDTIIFDDAASEFQLQAGAIIIASGADELQDKLPAFASGTEIHTAYSFERLLAMNGPTGGELLKKDGTPPASLAILHCAGSLDKENTPYCSATCCRAGIKYAHLAAARLPELTVTRLVREQVIPGVDAAVPFHNDHSHVVRYQGLPDLALQGSGNEQTIHCNSTGEQVAAEMVLLLRPIIPSQGTASIAELLELERDNAGFLSPLHPLADPCASSVKGIYLAGSCRGAADLRDAFASGTAAAGHALSALVEGRELVVDPQVASVNTSICAGCKTCLPLCPYKAISWNEQDNSAFVTDILCRGCGVCVAACPAGAISGQGFTREMLRAELKGVLS